MCPMLMPLNLPSRKSQEWRGVSSSLQRGRKFTHGIGGISSRTFAYTDDSPGSHLFVSLLPKPRRLWACCSGFRRRGAAFVAESGIFIAYSSPGWPAYGIFLDRQHENQAGISRCQQRPRISPIAFYCMFMSASTAAVHSAEKKSKGECIRQGFSSAPNARWKAH